MEPGSEIEPTVRERVMAAGLVTAETHGLSRMSMGDVAKQAGVSRQTVYRYFPSKEALVAAVVEHEAATLIANADAAMYAAKQHGPGGYRLFDSTARPAPPPRP